MPTRPTKTTSRTRSGYSLKNLNDQIAEQREAVEAIALRISRGAAASRVGAEYDDLVQEGLIQVWQNLERKVTPLHYVELRMIDYRRWIGTQTGIPRECEFDPETGAILTPMCQQHVPYEVLLPIDDFRSDSRNEPFPDAAQLR